MRGRRPKTPRLKILNGSREKLCAGPSPDQSTIKTPSHLTKAAKAIWKVQAPIVSRMGLLTDADSETFGHYCELTATVRKLTREIADEGEIVDTIVLDNNGEQVSKQKANPKVPILRAAEKERRQIACAFGLDPTSRSRIHVDAASKDSFEDYLNDVATG